MNTSEEKAEFEALKLKYETDFDNMTFKEVIRLFSFQYDTSDDFFRQANDFDLKRFYQKAGGGLAVRMQSPYPFWGYDKLPQSQRDRLENIVIDEHGNRTKF
jgi:hypothetical protein